MNKRDLIQTLSSRRDALGLSNAQVAERSGLTERSVRNVFGPLGNPQLSSLLALVDALDLELNLAPRGFGQPVAAEPGYRPVTTRIGDALARQPAVAAVPRGKP